MQKYVCDRNRIQDAGKLDREMRNNIIINDIFSQTNKIGLSS